MRETLVDGPDPLLGSRVAGRYTVMRRIAKGGMGVVYLAVQEGLGRAVALKIIRREAAGDAVMQKRFEREAKAVAQLGHPSIVTVHDFGKTDDGSLFLAMEFVDGEVLRDALKRRKRFTFLETLPVVESVCSALARAHGAGVVHRDLKPENVMLPKQTGTSVGAVAAKVLDFGLAKPHDPDQVEEHLTRDGGFVGTPGYASPEQAEGAPEAPQQDLYALGILWFELLSGDHPFTAPTPMKVVARQLNEEPPSLDGAKLDDVPAPAVALIRRLMARRPEDRPLSAQSVLEELPALKAAALKRAALTPSPPAPEGQSAASALYQSDPSAVTLDGKGLAGAPTVTTPPRAFAGAAPVPVVTGPPAKKRGGGLAVAAAAVLAAAGGAVVVVMLTSEPESASVADAGAAVDAVDDPVEPAVPVVEVSRGIEVVLERVPTFSALQGVRAALPASKLDVYTAERATLYVDGADAAALAERLQGLPLASAEPLVLEVKELARGRVVVSAVKPEEASALQDAGVLAGGDAGAVDVDAGAAADGVIAPGGLAP